MRSRERHVQFRKYRLGETHTDMKRGKIVRQTMICAASFLLSIVLPRIASVANARADQGGDPSDYVEASDDLLDSVQFVADFLADNESFGKNGDQRVPRSIAIALAKLRVNRPALIRNVIYARHGYIFHQSPWKNIFPLLPWYKPNKEFRDDQLTGTEKELVSESRSQEKFEPTIIVDDRSSGGPGFFIGTGEEAESHIFGPLIDDKEQIYILDGAMNRMQHFDANGKFIGSVPIASMWDTTKEERRKVLLMPEQIGIIKQFSVVDGAVYALQADRTKPASFPGHLLRMTNDSFIDADNDVNAADIRRKLESTGRLTFKEEIAQIGATENEFLLTHPLEKSPWDVYLDKDKNAWVLSFFGMRVYSPAGKILYSCRVEYPNEEGIFMRLGYTLSKRGNLYVLVLYDENTGKSYRDGGFDSGGLRVLKYSLHER